MPEPTVSQSLPFTMGFSTVQQASSIAPVIIIFILPIIFFSLPQFFLLHHNSLQIAFKLAPSHSIAASTFF
uniref:Uncharacterized protein n=1 Tax=Arundo donax TaxID=35708 RepID=A0A0A9ANK3_ARUDO